MNFRKKTSNITKALYVVLAMCILSIVGLILYSLFNSNNHHQGHNDRLSILQNQDQDAADALASRQQPTTTAAAPAATTQRPPPATQRAPMTTQPPTAATEAPVTAPPPPTVPAHVTETREEAPVIRQEPPAPHMSAPAVNPPAFSQDDEMEESIEVMAVSEAAPTTFIRPLNGNLSRFHRPYVAEFSLAMNDFRTHTGIDIDGEIGANVRAVADGVIAEIRDDPLMGKTVVIEHRGGIVSIYQNLQALIPQNITVGASVSMGDTIGGVGQTALIEQMSVPHLHFELLINGEHVDPLEYIDFG